MTLYILLCISLTSDCKNRVTHFSLILFLYISHYFKGILYSKGISDTNQIDNQFSYF